LRLSALAAAFDASTSAAAWDDATAREHDVMAAEFATVEVELRGRSPKHLASAS